MVHSCGGPVTGGNEQLPATASVLARANAPARLVAMLIGGGAAAVGTGLAGEWAYSPLAGWDVAALVFTLWTWTILATFGPTLTATHATREEPGRAQTDLIVICAAVASLVAVGYVLIQASSAKGSSQDWLASLGVVSVVLSWFAVHTSFALRYARLYYSGTEGGIDFNQQSPAPRYLDFAYVAFTIGMCYQVSDTTLRDPQIRRTVLAHAILSYVFGVVIVAGSVNLISGLFR